jgi:hypothetical protein
MLMKGTCLFAMDLTAINLFLMKKNESKKRVSEQEQLSEAQTTIKMLEAPKPSEIVPEAPEPASNGKDGGEGQLMAWWRVWWRRFTLRKRGTDG